MRMQAEWLPQGEAGCTNSGSKVYAQEILEPLTKVLGELFGKVKELVTAIAMEGITGDVAAAQLEDLLNTRHVESFTTAGACAWSHTLYIIGNHCMAACRCFA